MAPDTVAAGSKRIECRDHGTGSAPARREPDERARLSTNEGGRVQTQRDRPILRGKGVTPSPQLAGLLVFFVLAGCSMPAVPHPQAAPAPTATAMMIADYPLYQTVGDLAAESDLVVTVKIGRSRDDVSRPIESEETDPALNPQAGVEPSQRQDDPGTPITVYQATVERVHLGEASAGDTIEVGRLGGILDNTVYQSNETPLRAGGTYLLFLSALPGHPGFALGGDQGVFVPADDGGFTSISDGLVVDAATLAALR